MNLLIVAATDGEIAPFTTHLENAVVASSVSGGILISGVGMMATTYNLTKHLQTNRYDLVLQVGVGGSFSKDIPLGDVVFVTTDRYGDLGAEDHNSYIDIFDMGLIGENEHPHIGGRLITPLLPIHDKIVLPHASGLTINTVSGNADTIKKRYDQYLCDVESMEGAALHYVCLKEGVPFAQVRAISNYVTPRDKSQWKMKEAIINLNKWLIHFVDSLNQ
jgi:futalosine hydrolase